MFLLFTISVNFSAEIEDEEIEELAFQERISESDDRDDAVTRSQLCDVKEVPKISWLLSVVLNNLGVIVGDSAVRNCFWFIPCRILIFRMSIQQRTPTVQSVTMVRIESKTSLHIVDNRVSIVLISPNSFNFRSSNDINDCDTF